MQIRDLEIYSKCRKKVAGQCRFCVNNFLSKPWISNILKSFCRLWNRTQFLLNQFSCKTNINRDILKRLVYIPRFNLLTKNWQQKENFKTKGTYWIPAVCGSSNCYIEHVLSKTSHKDYIQLAWYTSFSTLNS